MKACVSTQLFHSLKALNCSWGGEVHCGLIHSPVVYLFKSSFFHRARVHKKWGLTHRPPSWLTTSGQTSVGSKIVRNRGATPKCHHSCKTAEHKGQITEICTLRLPDNENRGTLEWLLPEPRSAVEVLLQRAVCCHEQETQGEVLMIVWEFLKFYLCLCHVVVVHEARCPVVLFTLWVNEGGPCGLTPAFILMIWMFGFIA